MNSKAISSVVSALVVVLMVGLAATPSLAQTPAFSNFSSVANLTLNGSAAQSGNVLRITPTQQQQAGSVWFNTQQAVADGFSTTFRFQIGNGQENFHFPADGFAFVIQNSGLRALGPTGCGLGYGNNPLCTPATTGIPHSLAIEFDTYSNGASENFNNNHIAVQSCFTAANSADNSSSCTLAANYALPFTLADGAVHKVTVTYAPRSNDCEGPCAGPLRVIVDDRDLFPAGVSVDVTALGLNSGNAWLGFTGSTGASVENGDILSWSFTPASQSIVATKTEPTVIPFQDNAFTYEAQLNGGNPSSSETIQVTPLIMNQDDCNALVQTSYPGAKCFVYKDAGGAGIDRSVMFELTCPQASNNPLCDPFDSELGTTFDFSLGNNSAFPTNPDALDFTPFPGWLKGHGPVAAHPCQANPGNSPALFQSNQITTFFLTATDPKTKGGSGGTGSCWVATYNQPDEMPPAITIIAPTNAASYVVGPSVVASYKCSNPTTSHPTGNSTGPYLTAASCQQSIDGGPFSTGTCAPVAGGIQCTGALPTSLAPGPHTFTVRAKDSGKNANGKSVSYTLLGPAADLAILKVGLPIVRTGKNLKYVIGATNLGTSTATGITIGDQLPAGEAFVSASGTNESCSVNNKKLVCAMTPVPCTFAAGLVTCNVGSLMPLSWSSLNGAVVQLTVTVTAGANSKVKNTATVRSYNTDPKPNNNSSSFTTSVTH